MISADIFTGLLRYFCSSRISLIITDVNLKNTYDLRLSSEYFKD